VRATADGWLRVRLLGRVHEAPDYESLFDSVSRERERLIQAAARSRDVSHPKSYSALARVAPGEMYHRDVQRLEDRVAVYNHFLGHLARRLHGS
jgi:hypothetical protein